MDPFTIMAIAMAASTAVSAGSSYLASEGQKSANEDNRDSAWRASGNDWGLMQWQKAVEQDFQLQSRTWQNENWGRETEYNSQQAALNRIFQEQMSNSSYQRGVADMRKAGINPILAYGQGGASTPTGSAASASSASPPQGRAPGARPTPVPRVENALGPYASSGQQIAGMINGLQQMAANIDNTKANTQLAEANSRAAESNIVLNSARAVESLQNASLRKRESITEAENPAVRRALVNLQGAQAGQAAATAQSIEQRRTHDATYGYGTYGERAGNVGRAVSAITPTVEAAGRAAGAATGRAAGQVYQGAVRAPDHAGIDRLNNQYLDGFRTFMQRFQ